jgi:hypothetical protein
LMIFWLWQWGHSMALSSPLTLFSHTTNSMTST